LTNKKTKIVSKHKGFFKKKREREIERGITNDRVPEGGGK
jgi:hypothetical protein